MLCQLTCAPTPPNNIDQQNNTYLYSYIDNNVPDNIQPHHFWPCLSYWAITCKLVPTVGNNSDDSMKNYGHYIEYNMRCGGQQPAAKVCDMNGGVAETATSVPVVAAAATQHIDTPRRWPLSCIPVGGCLFLHAYLKLTMLMRIMPRACRQPQHPISLRLHFSHSINSIQLRTHIHTYSRHYNNIYLLS